MEQWKMRRLGFRNFWLYDKEDFWISQGHLLLRGSNASGKSITTQSFVPFILDGNRSPERLDPFGSRDRKMDYYLLGDGEKEESTGYLFAEFQKQGLEVYTTIGIGLRAQKGKGLDFWGFCLCDGRRIGKDIELYEKLGKEMLPLTKQKLKNVINDPENWAETPTAYKKLVNDRLYGFRDLRQFDQMVQLLIKVRAPKLSKDAFRPEEVKKILNESLQVLTDDDLSAMVSTMERMDELTAALQSSREAKGAASIIRTEYNRYNQYMLGKKGKLYLDALGRERSCQEQLARDRAGAREEEMQREAQTTRRDKAHQALLQARAQRNALGEDDLARKQAELEELQVTKTQQEERLNTDENNLKTLENAITQKEIRLRDRHGELRGYKQELETRLKSLTQVNRVAQLDSHEDFLKAPENVSPIRAACKSRKRMTGDSLAALQSLDQLQDRLDLQAQEQEEAARQASSAATRAEEAQIQEREERDRLIENLIRWLSQCRELQLEEEDTGILKQSVAHYRVPSDWTVLHRRLGERVQQLDAHLVEARLEPAAKREHILGELQKTEIELTKIKNQSEPTPPRRKQTDALRIQLTLMGIPFRAFYEAVEFAPKLSQQERDLLEAQLMDAGLLDALLVPESARQDLAPLLEEYPERFLIPGERTADPITSLLPAADNPVVRETERCLQAISQSDLGAQTALLPDGRFRCGMVTGQAHGYDPAGFVGAAARKANRQRKIDELTCALEGLQDRRRALEEQLEELDRRRKELREEWGRCPGSQDLDCAIETLNEANRMLALAQTDLQTKQKHYQQAKQERDRQETACRELCRGLPYARTQEDYREALDALEDYGELLNQIDSENQLIAVCRQQYTDLEADVQQLQDQCEDQRKNTALSRQALQKTQAVVREMEAFLNRPENVDRARRIHQLEQTIRQQDAIEREAEGERIRLDTHLQETEKRILELEVQMAGLKEETSRREVYFREDLGLRLVEKIADPEDPDTEALAGQAFGLLQPADRERSPEQLGEALRGCIQKHDNVLLAFHPKLAMTFEPGAEGDLRQRFLYTLQKDGKEMSLFAFLASVEGDIALTESVLKENDRRLFENILLETISHKLRSRIRESQGWCREMSQRMCALDTSMGMRFSLEWKPKKAETPEELDTEKLVTLLSKNKELLTRQDRESVSNHFRARVQAVRALSMENEDSTNYADLIRQVLDYRTWFEFRLYFQRDGEQRKELTNRVFSKFSGGEKAMAMYVPLFASVSAQYQKANENCPKVIALDEAFAGVDDRNISAMFALVRDLDFDYIMNSQALWGCYPSVQDLNIVELQRPANASFVTLLRYYWNGSVRQLEDTDG